MATTFAENYVSTWWQGAAATNITAELTAWAAAPAEATGDVEAKQKLLAIELAVAEGNKLFLKRQYTEAIESYKKARGLLYQLLNPSFPLAVATRDDISLTTDPTLFRLLLRVGLEFVEALAPRPPDEVTFGAPFINPPDSVIKDSAVYGVWGITNVDGFPPLVQYLSGVAQGYARRGQWKRAEFFYQQAQQQLRGVNSPGATSAQAALDLSLAGVLVQMDRVPEAQTLLERAQGVYRSTKDTVGLAQVNLNRAAAHARLGQHEEANRLAVQAQQLLDEAEGRPLTTTQTVSTPTVTPTIPLVVSNFADLFTPRAGASAQIETLALTISNARSSSIRPDNLRTGADSKGLTITTRQPGRGGGWTSQRVETRIEVQEKATTKSLRLRTGSEFFGLQWKAGDVINAETVETNFYRRRLTITKLEELQWRRDFAADTALQLPHLYYYVLPVAFGDCYHELGEFETAQTYYLKAADYDFINPAVEVPALWKKLAQNVLDWGDRFYRDQEPSTALNVYRAVAEPPGGASVIFADSPLYKHPKLKPFGDKIAAMLGNLPAGVNGINPALAAVVLEVRARLLQLSAGLDFLGMPSNLVPIWSFEFLQNVARYFAQQAIQAEREFINWWDRAENESLTRQQLQQTVTIADAEQTLSRQQREASEAEATAYSMGSSLATLRRQNAEQNRNDYSAMSWERIWLNRSNAWYSSQNPWELEHTIVGSGPDVGRHVHEVIADNTERLQTITRNYELASMNRQIDEMKKAEEMAQAQLNAANARTAAARQMEEVARLRREAAGQNLAAFNNQFFTPEVWYQMGAFMRSISNSYLYKAIRIARLMQRAYNFENDLDRRFIKTDYSVNTVEGMLAGDALLLDIDSFTYDLITTVQRKELPVKHSVSLAERYPFLFETAFRPTGKVQFELRAEDLDQAYPGTYGRRVESVEVEVEGVLPAGGVRGTLTNGGISRYRTTDLNQTKFRIQPKETMVLSEYRTRQDTMIFPADPKKLKVFEGAGVEGTWTVEIPRATNDVDYRAISDVRLTFYFKARYDGNLESAARARLASLPGSNRAGQLVPLRWSYPDAFFNFLDTAQLKFELTPLDFPYQVTNPQIRQLSLKVVTDPGVNPAGWRVRLGVPARPETVAVNPNAQGEIIVNPGHPWQALASGNAIGNYLVELRAAENASLVVDGKLKLTAIQNLVLILEYDYTPRA